MFFSGKDHEVKWSVQDVVSRRDTIQQTILLSHGNDWHADNANGTDERR